MTSREQLTVSFLPEKANVFPSIGWLAENKNIVSIIDDDEIAVIAGEYIGSTNIIVKSVDGNLKDTCKVTIEPYFYLYRNPLFDFIATIEEVKSYEHRILFDETNQSLYYYGDNEDVYLVYYAFSQEVLSGCVVVLNPSFYYNANTFLSERYYYLGENDGYQLFKINGNTLAGLTTSDELGVSITYIQARFYSYDQPMEEFKLDPSIKEKLTNTPVKQVSAK